MLMYLSEGRLAEDTQESEACLACPGSAALETQEMQIQGIA